MKKRALGRNLDVLLSRSSPVAEIQQVIRPQAHAGEQHHNELRHMPLDLLQRGRYQPRREMNQEAIQELADSIRAQGVIQPIVIRSISGGRYEIIAGERRWRAAQLAGLTEIPALIKEISDEAALAIALIENIQRENLNPLEEAVALQRLADEFSMTHQQIAEVVGKSRATISNLLRLIGLRPEIKTLIEQRKLEMGHARALLGLTGIPQIEAAYIVAERGLSVRETEQLVNRMQHPEKIDKAAKSFASVNPDIHTLQKNLSDKLGAMVVVRHTTKGKGKLLIHYRNLDELDGILARIQ